MKDNKDIILLILGVFVALGFLWQPLRNAQKEGGLFSGAAQTSTPSQIYDYPEGSYTTPQDINPINKLSDKEIAYELRQTESNLNTLEKNLQIESLKKKQSPYYGKVTLSSVAYLNSSDPSQEYIPLYANLSIKETLNITGWILKSERSGNSVRIGGASLLPKPSVQNNSDVILQSGDIAYIIKGFSPIGISFRTNKCTGYLAEHSAFYPYLQRTCPLPRDEKLPKFSTNLDRDDECIDLIERVPACSDPSTTMNFNKLPDTVTKSCKDYLSTKINYNTCVANHFGDTDFPGNNYYIYLNIFGPLWRDKRERIVLYDKSGLIVTYIDINNY